MLEHEALMFKVHVLVPVPVTSPRLDAEERRGLLHEFEELTTTVTELEEKSKSMADRDPKVIEAKGTSGS
ncbi:hypothetical protein SARC_00691 [Sphaeroforma arctica JP610]|uniref:Uncharacterized protein n=1 Tax=Sphaeroforma arctica JP610 TaxID=667725 RepID=A0A0L0GFV6_9EUKA|nr:hypothetical protein SARC_00691 [Sphaeroforma arctica JP610]KNC87163.1 hypothetical protein SARC_00691 [Sphaeroforma arctica JP610]|eukprot:XP_014161065.1 hypothetical protein SARC_00691 [Sphaeroforma arctica JP610]